MFPEQNCHLTPKIFIWNNQPQINSIKVVKVVQQPSSLFNIYQGNGPRVDFSYVFHSATFIEIALSNVTVRRRPTFALQKAAKNFGEQRIALLQRSRNRPLGSIFSIVKVERFPVRQTFLLEFEAKKFDVGKRRKWIELDP